MKVLFVHDGPIYKDENGRYYGVHINDELRRRYLNLGDELTLLMRVYPIKSTETGKFSALDPAGLSVIEVPNFKSFRLYFRHRKAVNALIEQAVLAHDIIMARLPCATGSIAVKYSQKHHKPLMTEVVACNWDSFWYYSLKGKLVAPYFFLKQKRIMRKIPYAIYVTKRFLQGRYPSPGKQINCSNVELRPVADEVLQRRLDKINVADFSLRPMQLGTVAAIDVPYKGQGDVIKALKLLKEEGIRIDYRIVGQGSPEMLNNLVRELGLEDQVEIVGALRHDEVFAFLDDIDLYIQPSKQEGLPRAMIEAMSRACPCLGAATAGIPELVAPEFIFPKSGVRQIAQLLKKEDKNLMIIQAKANFEAAREYDKAALHRKRMLFYKEFLQDNGLPLTRNLINLQ